jgi:hypothetical protein
MILATYDNSLAAYSGQLLRANTVVDEETGWAYVIVWLQYGKLFAIAESWGHR